MPSLRDSDQISTTHHFAFGFVVGCHDTRYGLSFFGDSFHPRHSELSFVTTSLAPRQGGKKEKPLPPLRSDLSGGSKVMWRQWTRT